MARHCGPLLISHRNAALPQHTYFALFTSRACCQRPGPTSTAPDITSSWRERAGRGWLGRCHDAAYDRRKGAHHADARSRSRSPGEQAAVEKGAKNAGSRSYANAFTEVLLAGGRPTYWDRLPVSNGRNTGARVEGSKHCHCEGSRPRSDDRGYFTIRETTAGYRLPIRPRTGSLARTRTEWRSQT